MLYSTPSRSTSTVRPFDLEFKQISFSYFFLIRNVILKIRHGFIKIIILKNWTKVTQYVIGTLWIFFLYDYMITVQNFGFSSLFFWTIYKPLVYSKFFFIFTTTIIRLEILKDKRNKTEVSKTAGRSTFKKKWYVNQ